MKTEFDIILQRMQRYCAYRDRSHTEVRTKLLQIKVYGDHLEEVLAALIQDDYLNEERFARSFVRGKFNQNRWGRRKIELALKKHHLSPYILKKALTEIDNEDYKKTIRRLWDKKFELVDESNLFIKRNKIYRYLLTKGYDSAEIKSVITELSK